MTGRHRDGKDLKACDCDEADLLDEDGYPTAHALKLVELWPHDHPEGYRGLLNQVKAIWYMADWGWHEEPGVDAIKKPVTKLHISTAGWSGNESLIRALQANWLFWGCCWEQSRRGGHFIFELRGES